MKIDWKVVYFVVVGLTLAFAIHRWLGFSITLSFVALLALMYITVWIPLKVTQRKIIHDLSDSDEQTRERLLQELDEEDRKAILKALDKKGTTKRCSESPTRADARVGDR